MFRSDTSIIDAPLAHPRSAGKIFHCSPGRLATVSSGFPGLETDPCRPADQVVAVVNSNVL